MNRCKWCNLKNPLYVKYHDEEWGVANFDDKYLFMMLILESFQAGLSWECVLNKRDNFIKAYDDFEIDKICNYDDSKIEELYNNKGIIRNKLKIKASINNYLKEFTKDKIYYEIGLTHSDLSDMISKDLQKRKMKFVGSTIIYAYLQAVGIVNSHDKDCFLYKK